LYFDATGELHKPYGDCTILFYSLACHDVSKRVIMPVGEFFTSVHTTDNISTYLNDIFNLITLPKIVVTDFSWALITSVMISFNKTDVNHYLKYCYTALISASLDNSEKKRVFSKLFLLFRLQLLLINFKFVVN
jgi:hypothetical protein